MARWPEDKLTAKQEKFAMLIADGTTQRDAFIKSYEPKGWTDKSINEKASSIANKAKIKSRVAALKAPILKKFEENQEHFAQTIVNATYANKSDEADHKVRKEAAKTGLDYIGYKPPEKNINLQMQVSREEVDKLLDNLY